MQRAIAIVVVCALAACGGKKDSGGGGGAAGSAGSAAAGGGSAMTCPPGSVVKDGACLAVVTPEKVAAVAQQQSRLDDLGKLLDHLDAVSAPIQLLDAIRQLDQWKQLAAKHEKLRILDKVVEAANQAVTQLQAFRGSLGEASKRLGNLHGELDALLKDPTVSRQLDDVRAKVSAELRGALEPLAQQAVTTIRDAIAPLSQQLSDAADLVIGACAMAKLSGGSDQLKDLCAQAKEVFQKATTFLDDLKTRPALLFTEVSAQLEGQLDQLLDQGAKAAIDKAQQEVNTALRLPPSPPTTGSGSGSGSGSAGSGT
jgi:hypothetical protein